MNQKNVSKLCLLALDYWKLCTYQLKSQPPSPSTPGQGGQCGGFLWYLKRLFTRGDGGFLKICFTHLSRSGSEVGIGLMPSFLKVISSRGPWCHLLDFCSFNIWFWKVSFLIIFPFISSFEKYFRITISGIKTWRFCDMSPLLNANYYKLVNVI